MRRLLALFLLAVALSWSGAPYGNQNARKHGGYSTRTTRAGRGRAVYSRRTSTSGSHYKRLGTRQRNGVIRMAPRRGR